eukprot:6208851-Pleurochrysis_carterae.AAC.2
MLEHTDAQKLLQPSGHALKFRVKLLMNQRMTRRHSCDPSERDTCQIISQSQFNRLTKSASKSRLLRTVLLLRGIIPDARPDDYRSCRVSWVQQKLPRALAHARPLARAHALGPALSSIFRRRQRRSAGAANKIALHWGSEYTRVCALGEKLCRCRVFNRLGGENLSAHSHSRVPLWEGTGVQSNSWGGHEDAGKVSERARHCI